jgi:AcrR family transcriptional regulator
MARRHAATEALREKVLAEALRQFAEHGFAATSTREIAAATGLTKAALYYHFPSKDDILAALIAPMIASVEGIIATVGEQDTPARQRSLLAAYIDLTDEHADLLAVFSQDPSIRTRPAARRAVPGNATLTRMIAGGDDVTARTRARAALGGIHAAVRFRNPDDDPALVRHAALLAACGALGIEPPESGPEPLGNRSPTGSARAPHRGDPTTPWCGR